MPVLSLSQEYSSVVVRLRGVTTLSRDTTKAYELGECLGATRLPSLKAMGGHMGVLYMPKLIRLLNRSLLGG